MKMRTLPRVCLLILLAAVVCHSTVSAQSRGGRIVLENSAISGTVTIDGLTSLTSPSDSFGANVIGERSWGRASLTYEIVKGSWLEIFKGSTRLVSESDNAVSIINYEKGMPQKMEQRYTLTPGGIDYDINIESMMQWPVTIGDLAVSLPFRRPGGGNPEAIFEKSFTMHQFISGSGSFIYFARPSGEGPFLMVLPKKGTKLEYFDDAGEYKVFIHSAVSGPAVKSGTWRQQHTSLNMGPAGSENSRVSYGFKLRWAQTWDDMRQLLYDEGLFDIRVVPGMTIPSDLKALFSLHTKNKIDSVTAEFPLKTKVKYLGEKQQGHFIWEAEFGKLGENLLTVHYDNGQKTYLEFFSTEPVETLIKKRSSFIVNSQQHRDTTKWYNGLFSVYDMKNGILRSPDDTDGFDGWWGYVLACDDPALCKAPYLAAKNVYYPDDSEIEAIEYYLENFVWNGLQRTDKDDPYPYGIYGVPNWKVSRDINARAGIRSRQLDRMQVWRSYDYPHIFMLYYHMYQIAKMYPEKVKYLSAEQYLERAYMTARAFFIYPYEIWGDYYKPYEIACYNELVIEDIVSALQEGGRTSEAKWLKGEYEKKAKFFIYDNRYPYGSEYSFDRTAFESSYALAKYGVLNNMSADTNLWYDKNAGKWLSHPVVRQEDARDFMERQHHSGLTVKGWLETSYYQLGADNSMSYMAKMGGWSILDYGINFAEKPSDWLQLGYASYLSSFALMNTGTAESDYGFWFPGKKNDGAMGWAFMDNKHGMAWMRKEVDRGAWFYDGEADLGNGAIFRMAQTVLSNDPLFGWIAYGGILRETKTGFLITPKDGVRNRFSLVAGDRRLSVTLERDGFSDKREISVSKNLKSMVMYLENRAVKDHDATVSVENHTGHKVTLKLDGKKVMPVSSVNGFTRFDIKVAGNDQKIEVLTD